MESQEDASGMEKTKTDVLNLHNTKSPLVGLARRDSDDSSGHDSGIELCDAYEDLTALESGSPACSTSSLSPAFAQDQNSHHEEQLKELLSMLLDKIVDLYTQHRHFTVTAPTSRSESVSSSFYHMSTTQSGSSSSSVSLASSSSKRSLSTRDDQDGAEEDEHYAKRSRSEDDPESSPATLFACPYSKYDPYRYSPQNLRELRYRGCWSAYLTSIPNVKQHLYRKHKRPEHYCPCCFEEFSNHQTLENHSRRRSCVVGHCTFAERMNADQEAQIKKRTPGVDLAEKWYNIYRILFPARDLPNNPWAEFGNAPSTDDFIAFFAREAPHQLSSLITEEYASFFPSDEALQNFLSTALQRSLSTVVTNMHNMYRSSDRDLSTTASQPLPIFNGLQLPNVGAQHTTVPGSNAPTSTYLPQRPTMTRDALPLSSCSVATIRGLPRPVTAPPQLADLWSPAPMPPYEPYFVPEWSFDQSNQYAMSELPLNPAQQQYQMYSMDHVGPDQQMDQDMAWNEQPPVQSFSNDTGAQGSYSGRVEDWLFSRGSA